MRLTKNTLSNDLALATAVLWVVCSAFVALFSDAFNIVVQWWAHGKNVIAFDLSWGNFIWGSLTMVVSFWIADYMLGWSLEFLYKYRQAGKG